MTIRVLLADDHAMLRAGLRALLNAEPDITVVAEAANGEEAVRLAEQHTPNVVVMDISMPVLDGLAATAEVTDRLPDTRVLVLTMHAEEQYLLKVLEAGGSGYVLKRSADTELMQAIRAVARGEAYLYPSATRLLLEAYKQGGQVQAGGEGQLSERESEVLRLTAEGYSNTEIGGQLYLSPKTVDTYRQRIMEKLGLHHRAELVRYALATGLLRPPADPTPPLHS
jgi:two-component system, NarL family, response regulator NreC